MRIRYLLLVVVLAAFLAPSPAPGQTGEPTTVFLVRHAEKAAEPADDPPLTAAGSERAELLARMLSEAGVTAIYSSEYLRTRLTVEPLAAAAGLEVTEFPARDSAGLAQRIRAEHAGGVVVVAGHSNTVPGIITALGGGEMPWIDEAVYDNLFVVSIDSNGSARLATLKFGAASHPGDR